MSWINLIAIFVGGGLGSLSRYLVSRLVLLFEYTGKFPLATLLANVVACAFMAGIIYAGVKGKSINEHWQMFWLVGFCGGFSTFSTFSFENWLLYRDGFYLELVLNLILSIGICMLLFVVAGKYFSATA